MSEFVIGTAGLALIVSVWGLVRQYQAAPPVASQLNTGFRELAEIVAACDTQVRGLSREFQALNGHVDEQLEAVSSRLQRAKTAESNQRRKTRADEGANGADTPRPLSIGEQFALAQAHLRDGTGPFGR